MKVSVEIPDETASEINNWIDTRLNTGPTKKMSHGPLDLGRLTQLLLEEVARTARGSWGTGDMVYLLDEKGYKT